LTLVVLIMIPLLMIVGGARSLIISKKASRGQSADAKAANVVEQTIGLIRTVCCTDVASHRIVHTDQVSTKVWRLD